MFFRHCPKILHKMLIKWLYIFYIGCKLLVGRLTIMTDLLKKRDTKYAIVFIWLLVSLFLFVYIGIYAVDYLRIGIVYMLHVGAISTYLMKRWLRNEKEVCEY